MGTDSATYAFDGPGRSSAITSSPRNCVTMSCNSGRNEIGRMDPSVLTEERPTRRPLRAGPNWQVTYVDWGRKRAFVEPVDGGGVAKWSGSTLTGLSYALTRSMREVLLGAEPPISLVLSALDVQRNCVF